MKEMWIWIYEFKDNDTPIGATLYEGWAKDLPENLELPHLCSDWHWRIETSWEEEK